MSVLGCNTKPWKQWIQSIKLAEMDLKSIIAKAVAAAMDVKDVAKRTEQAKESKKAEEFQAGQHE